MDELTITLPLTLAGPQTQRVVTMIDHLTFTDPALSDLEPGAAFESTLNEAKIDAPGVRSADVNRLYDALIQAMKETE